jgi:hypothetical protein
VTQGEDVKESKFQADLIVELKNRFKGSIVIKNDPNYIQGIPDLLILHKNRWAALEVKASAGASRQPNQDYYVNLMDDMSYAAFICPENKDTVLDGLQRTFSTNRSSRVSQRQ